MGVDFPLIDEAAVVRVHKFDGIFDGDNVIGATFIDVVDHGGQGGGFTTTRWSGHEHESLMELTKLLQCEGEV